MNRRSWRARYTTPQLTATAGPRRRPSRYRGVALAVVVAGTIMGLAWWLLASPTFAVRDIVVTGTLNDAVAAELTTLKGRNIFLLRTNAIESAIPAKQSSLASIHIIKGFPATLKLAVTVRSPVLRWRSSEAEYLIDEEGYTFLVDGEAPPSLGSLPLVVDEQSQPVKLGTRHVSRRFVNFAAELSAVFADRIGRSVASLSVAETTRHLTVTTDSGLRIRFDATRTVEVQLTTLARVLDEYRDQVHESVDLRVEGKVFYK